MLAASLANVRSMCHVKRQWQNAIHVNECIHTFFNPMILYIHSYNVMFLCTFYSHFFLAYIRKEHATQY
jgi:hypothetical protein